MITDVSRFKIDVNNMGTEINWIKAHMGGGAIYVDGTNGNDEDEGLSSETAVKTINKALEIIKRSNFTGNINIYLTPATYDEDVILDFGQNVQLILSGDTTLKSLTADSNTNCDVTTNGYNFTVTERVDVFLNSVMHIDGSLSTSQSYITTNSVLYCTGNLSLVDTSNDSNTIQMFHGGVLDVDGDLTISSTNKGSNYSIYVGGNVCIGVNGSTTINYNGNASHAISLSGFSYIVFNPFNLTSNTGGISLFQSACRLYNSRITANGNSTCITVNQSKAYFYSGATFVHSSSSSDILNVSDSSVLSIANSPATFSGTCRYTVLCIRGSVCDFYNTTFSGTVTGKRYHIERTSSIDVGGQGVNAIPGSTAGAASSASFSFYG